MTYLNKFHNPRNQYSSEYLNCDTPPVEYKGFLVFHRIVSKENGGNVFDIVKDGECIGMYAGINGAKRFIDGYCGTPVESDPHVAPRKCQSGCES